MIAKYLASLCLLLLCNAACADVEVLGLFKGAALLQMDGQQKLLKEGQTWQGVTAGADSISEDPPDWILNAAAFTAVDRCESETEACTGRPRNVLIWNR